MFEDEDEDDGYLDLPTELESDLISLLPEVGTFEWFTAMDADAVYDLHETQADYREPMTDIDETEQETEPEPEDDGVDVSLQDVSTKAAAPIEPQPKWDDSVGIADDYPRGHPRHRGGEVWKPGEAWLSGL
jgi:hypothetical protein